MAKLNLTRLRELAGMATPGPWEAVSDSPSWAIAADKFDVVATKNRQYRAHRENFGCWDNDAEFIAAANPQTITALLDLIQEMRVALEKMEYEYVLTSEPPAGKRMYYAREALEKYPALVEE